MHSKLTWWRHQMELFSALLAICAGIHRSPVISPHKGQWRGALMFSLICAWINGWANNREAGDLRRHHAHCDVTVMMWLMGISSVFQRPLTFPLHCSNPKLPAGTMESAPMAGELADVRLQGDYERVSLQWRHNEHHSVSNHRQLQCFFDPKFRRTSKETPKLASLSLCEGNPPVTGGPVTGGPVTDGFPLESGGYAENVSTPGRRHVHSLWPHNWPNSQIPQCTSPISHNAPFCNRNVHTCAHFCYKMVHCGIFVSCIVGFVRWVHWAMTYISSAV